MGKGGHYAPLILLMGLSSHIKSACHLPKAMDEDLLRSAESSMTFDLLTVLGQKSVL